MTIGLAALVEPPNWHHIPSGWSQPGIGRINGAAHPHPPTRRRSSPCDSERLLRRRACRHDRGARWRSSRRRSMAMVLRRLSGGSRLTCGAGSTPTFCQKNVSSSSSGQNANPGTWIEVPPVPETSTWAMMILGCCGLGFIVRTRRRSTPHSPPSA
jgi:hypothetical protein